MRRKLADQTATASTLLPQLREGEVLRISYAYGANPDSGLYLFPEDLNQAELERRMRPAGDNSITFYAVPEDEM